MSQDEENAVQNGQFAGADFSLSSVNYPITTTDKEVVIYLHNMSVNEDYQTTENWIMLWKSFGQHLYHLIQTGITIRSIYTCLFRDDHQALFEQMGFQLLVDNTVKGKVYHIDLTQQALPQFSWIIPKASAVPYSASEIEQNITFRQLSCTDQLSEQQLKDIAGLIYDTDAYIYPALFSRKQAKKILPMLFEYNMDTMFNLNNIFCATTSADRIVGIILHKKGPLNWSSKHLLKFANLFDEKLPETVKIVENEYFKDYNKTDSETRAILNVCVNGNFRMQDELRLGTQMIKAFLQAHHSERMELYVLQETRAAMRLYLRNGFIIENKCNGFSISKEDLPCYFMYRPAE